MPYDDAPPDDERELTRLFRAWGADEESLPALIARASAAAAPHEVWLRHLYDQHAAALVRFAGARLGSVEEAEDVVQDVFLQVAAALDAYCRDRGTPRAWLYNLTRGLASNRARARRRRGAREAEAAAPDEAWAELHDLAPDLRRALAALPPECLEVLWLRRVEELTQAETADALGIPFGTVLSRLNRAERLLREALARERQGGLVALPAVLAVGAGSFEASLPALRGAFPLPAERRDALWLRAQARLPPGRSPRARLPVALRRAATHVAALSAGALSAALWLRPSVEPPPERAVTAASPLAAATPAAAPPADPPRFEAAAPTPPTTAPPRARGEAPSPEAPDDDPARQNLRRARAALARRAVADARAALDAAERAMGPRDSREHVDSLRVEAAMLAGERAQAEALVARFRERYPRSAHLARLESWLR